MVASSPPMEAKHVPDLGLADERILNRRPVWRFAKADMGGDWPLHNASKQELGLLIEKLGQFETMKIGSIFAPGAEHGKRYAIELLPAAPRKRLEELEHDDETELVRLRLGGRERLYGILRENIFHILWWDPDHAVLPSMKRNT